MTRACRFLVRGPVVSVIAILYRRHHRILAVPRQSLPPRTLPDTRLRRRRHLSADAAFVMDATTGTELFALNPDKPLPPASLTKIVAAIVILESANLDDVVEIEEADLVDENQSQVGLVKGDRLAVRDLFTGMLVPSGNDATLALARFVGESRLGADVSAADAVAAFVRSDERSRSVAGCNGHPF